MRRSTMLCLAAFAFGGLLTLAQAPLNWWAAPFASFTLFLGLLDKVAAESVPESRRRDSFWLGWAFAFGFFTTGLYWIGASMLVEAGKFWWALPIAVAGLPAYLALYPATAIMLWQDMRHRWRLPQIASLSLFAVLWSASEWLRGHVLTGFPWLLLGYDWQALAPIEQTLSLWGAYGLGLLSLFFYGWPWACLTTPKTQRTQIYIFGALLAFGFGATIVWGQERLATRMPNADRIHLRLVQPDISQKAKLDRSQQADIVNRLVSMSQMPSDLLDRAAVNVTIWPEASISFYPQYDDVLRQRLRLAVPRGLNAVLVLGAPARDDASGSNHGDKDFHYYNSLFAINADGTLVGRYDKSHLVPFGEFFPLRSILKAVGIDISAIAAGSVDYSFGKGLETLALPGLPPASPLICYEAIFPGEVTAKMTARTSDILARSQPGWLLNITNDAWFGKTTGPYQHLAIARARAIEEGLPLVRTANTGISAIVDSFGRMQAQLGLDENGVIDGWLPPPLPYPTLFRLYGNASYALLWLACVILTVFLGRSRRVTPTHLSNQ